MFSAVTATLLSPFWAGDPTFYPFPHLPPELRNKIWEATIEPRYLRIKMSSLYCSSWTPVPAALQACRESRHYLASYYTRAFTYGTKPRYIWTNFAFDYIRAEDYPIGDFVAEQPFIRHVAIDLPDTDYIYYKYSTQLAKLPTLENLLLLTDEEMDDGWSGWIDTMAIIEERWHPLTPGGARPDVRIIDRSGLEMNSRNWRRLDREKRKTLAIRNPGMQIISDSENSS